MRRGLAASLSTLPKKAKVTLVPLYLVCGMCGCGRDKLDCGGFDEVEHARARCLSRRITDTGLRSEGDGEVRD